MAKPENILCPRWTLLTDQGYRTQFQVEEYVSMSHLISRFAKDESGATAIEYELIAGLISVMIIASVTAIGTKLNVKFGRISSALS